MDCESTCPDVLPVSHWHDNAALLTNLAAGGRSGLDHSLPQCGRWQEWSGQQWLLLQQVASVHMPPQAASLHLSDALYHQLSFVAWGQIISVLAWPETMRFEKALRSALHLQDCRQGHQ